MNNKFRRVISFLLTILLVYTFNFSALLNIAHANDLVIEDGIMGGAVPTNPNWAAQDKNSGLFVKPQLTNYRVSVQRTSDLYVDGSDENAKEVAEAYSYKYPNNWDSELYFVDDRLKSDIGDDFSLVKHDASTKGLNQYNSKGARDRVFFTGLSNCHNVYKGQLMTYSYFDSNKKDITDLADGKWKDIAYSMNLDWALGAWSYIFRGGLPLQYKTVEERINFFVTNPSYPNPPVNPSSKNEDKDNTAMGYLDLLMCAWRLADDKGIDSAIYWEQAIEDYIQVSNPLERPVSIVVDTVGALEVVDKNDNSVQYMLMPSIDFVNHYLGIRSAYDLQNQQDTSIVGGSGNTTDMLMALVNKQREDYPNEWGTNYSDRWSESPWNIGISDILEKNKRLVTYDRKKAHFVDSTDAYTIMEDLKSDKLAKDGVYGFLVAGYHGANVIPTDVGFNLKVTPTNKIVDATSEVIGEKVKLSLKVNSGGKTSSITSWRTQLHSSNVKELEVKLHIKRDGVLNKGNYESIDGDYLKGVKVSKANFIEILSGSKYINVFDNLTNEPIKQGEEKVYNYEIKVEVNWEENGEKKQWLSPDFGDSAFNLEGSATFYRTDVVLDDPMIYNNYPIQYAEIKHNGGTTYSDPKEKVWDEDFDAMSGVPSTERLFFSVGGTEFVLDMEVEYKQNTDCVWRKYTSVYEGTSCEHKTGDQCPVTHNYTPTPNKSQTATIPIHGSAPPPPDWYGNDEVHGYKKYSHTAVSDGVNRNGRETISYNESVTDPKCGCSGHGTDADGNSIHCPQGGHCLDAPGSVTWSSSVSSIAHMGCGPCHEHELPAIRDTWKQRVTVDYLKIAKLQLYILREGKLDKTDELFGTSVKELITQQSESQEIMYSIPQRRTAGDDYSAQSSLHGRLRYTLEPKQHDNVVWEEGVRSNKCDGSTGLGQGHPNAGGIVYNNGAFTDTLDYHIANSTSYDKARPEWQKFDERRNLKNNVTVISDALILHTTSGELSALYFDKEGIEITTQEQFEPIKATKEEMWDSNPYTAVNWTDNQVPIGGYNGHYTKVAHGFRNSGKYDGYSYDTKAFHKFYGLGNVPTIFDNDPAESVSNYKPYKPMINSIDAQLIPTLKNRLYKTGNAKVFYECFINWTAPNAYNEEPYSTVGAKLRPFIYKPTVQKEFGNRIGIVLDAPYSDKHSKVNDIIIHTPVSTEDAMIVGLDEERDQRTETPPGGASALIEEQKKLKICPLNPETCDFRVLNCEFLHEKDMLDVDFDSRDGSKLLNKITNKEIPYRIGSDMKIEPKDGFGNGDVLHVNGTRFSMDLGDIGIAYDKSLSYLVEMDFLMPTAPTNDGTMVISFGGYSFLIPKGSMVGGFTTNTNLDTRTDSEIVGKPIRLGLQFSFGHILDSKLFINGVEQKNVVKIRDTKITEDAIGDDLNIGSWGKSDNFGGTFYVDNLKVTKASGGTEHTNACYIDTKVHGVIKNHEHDDSCYSTTSGQYACNGLPLNSNGQVTTITTKKEWDFSSSLNGFAGGTTTISNSNNALVANRTDGDFYFYSPTSLSVRGESSDYIEITLKNNSSNSSSRIYFDNGSGWSESNAISFTTSTNDTGYKTYTVKIGGNSNWANSNISRLRFDLANGSGAGTVEVKSIKLKNTKVGNPKQVFSYTGNVQTFTAPQDGTYILELWGASGASNSFYSGGKGGYSKGTITLKKGETLQVYVGGKGVNYTGGFNGGATTSTYGGGGGASDIRYGGNTINDRIIVAGGGGGASDGGTGGNGGGLEGTIGTGGTQSNNANGAGGTQSYGGNPSYKGTGSEGYRHGGGGGGGYYGGNGGYDCGKGGGGGSGYIGGVDNGETKNSNRTGNGEVIISLQPKQVHEHTPNCPKVTSKSLICGYDSELNVVTDKNSHVHDASCGVYNGWNCNNLPLNDAYTTAKNEFNFTGAKQTYVVPADATYILEVWGAQGTSKVAQGGKGGYSKGEITLKKGQVLNLYVGGTSGTSVGGWNGGGSTGGEAGGGGGATDIRLGGDALANRIIVAGGGGGAQAGYGGAGGGLVGGDGEKKLGTHGLGGTQSQGGTGGGQTGTLGQGGNGVSGSDGLYGGAGGGGYYGGGGASSDHSLVDDSGGGGGSGYIGGVTNSITQANVQSGNGKIIIHSPSVATAHKHTSSCTTIKEYSCGGQVKNAHKDVTDYTGGVRTYAVFSNKAGKRLTTNGVQTTDGTYRINENQVITGPKDEYNAGTYLVTLRGKSLQNMNISVKGGNSTIVTSPLNTENNKEVKYIIGVMDDTDSLDFNITSNKGIIEVQDVKVEPITLREPIGLCPTCKKHVPLKSGGTKVQCSICSTDLYDFAERINFMSSTLNNAEGERQITIFGDGGKVAVLRVDNGYEINEDLSTKPDRNFEPYFKYEKAVSKGCKTVSELACTEPHHDNAHYDRGNDICWDACGVDENHKDLKDEVLDGNTGSVVKNATFINLDYPFKLYFPNRGHFAEDTNLRGISEPTSIRGSGYIDNMDTTKYTERKRVKFEFNVIYDGKLYLKNEWIELPVNQEYYDFYCVLANDESVSSKVEFEAIAINGRPIGDVQNDNYEAMSNKKRYNDFTALHGGYKQTWVDVVGRIGNFVLSDTDDFRFSNFFKIPKSDDGWLIEGILPNVRQDAQNEYYGDLVDIRGERVSKDTNFLNTYGSQQWLEKEPTKAPINPKDNPITQLKEKFMRVGYDIYGDISTIGSYMDGTTRVLPYYYKLDLDTNTVTPLDVYMKENDTYMLINKYSGADDNSLPEGIYHQNIVMDWEKEAARRNYMIDENLITDRLSDIYRKVLLGTTIDKDGNSVYGVIGYEDMDRPNGNYVYQGITQRHVLDSKSKTYIGSSQTYGEEMNIGGRIPSTLWEEKAQRWHIKMGLPSSSVFVETGKEPTQENIDAILNSNSIILSCADIITIGNPYTLRWQQPGISSFTIELDGNKKTYNIKNLGLPPVIALYEAGKTSVDDITISGTH